MQLQEREQHRQQYSKENLNVTKGEKHEGEQQRQQEEELHGKEESVEGTLNQQQERRQQGNQLETGRHHSALAEDHKDWEHQ